MKNGPYELISAPPKYPGKRYRGRYAYEHHVVWWHHHGSVPDLGMEIHHLNGNHRDNRIENLKIVTHQEHINLHAEMRRTKPSVRPCEHCGDIFTGKQSRVRFCSRKCAGKAGRNP